MVLGSTCNCAPTGINRPLSAHCHAVGDSRITKCYTGHRNNLVLVPRQQDSPILDNHAIKEISHSHIHPKTETPYVHLATGPLEKVGGVLVDKIGSDCIPNQNNKRETKTQSLAQENPKTQTKARSDAPQ